METTATITREQQIKEENKITNAKELAAWLKSHLKMRYRVAFSADGYGTTWFEPNTEGNPLIKSGGAFLDALATDGGATRYINTEDGRKLFAELIEPNDLRDMDFVEVTLAGVRFVFAVWVDWWTLRGLPHHI